LDKARFDGISVVDFKREAGSTGGALDSGREEAFSFDILSRRLHHLAMMTPKQQLAHAIRQDNRDPKMFTYRYHPSNDIPGDLNQSRDVSFAELPDDPGPVFAAFSTVRGVPTYQYNIKNKPPVSRKE
jgi:hypothetical protein